MASAAVIAAIGAASGSAILTLTLLYMRRLPGATPALSWWAAALAIGTVHHLILLFGVATDLHHISPFFGMLVAVTATLFLVGALIFVERRPDFRWIGAGLAAICGWLVVADISNLSWFARGVPLFLATAAALVATGIMFLRYRRDHTGLGYGFIGLGFILWGLQVSAFPLFEPATLNPWGMLLTQAMTLAIVLGLILSVQRRQAAELLAANRRAERSASGLAETERRLRDFAEISSDWMWEMGPDLQFTYISDRLRGAFGVNPRGSLGKRREDIHDTSQDPENWKTHLVDLADRRPFRNFRYRFKTPDGRTHHVAISGKPIFGEDGTFLGYRGTGRDATAEVEAAEQAMRAQLQLVGAIEGLATGVALFGGDDRLVMCNPAFRGFVGLDSDVLRAGLHFDDYFRARVEGGHVRVPPGVTREEFIADRIRRHRNPEGGIDRQAPDGRWFHIREQRLVDGSSVMMIHDISAAKEHERELQEKTDLLQGTLENMGEGISVHDASLRLIAWNQRLIELTGHPRAMYRVGTPMEEFVRYNVERGEYGPGEIETIVRDQLAMAALPSPQRSARWRATGRYVEMRRNPMPNGGFVTVYSDLTDRKRAEDALREAKDVAESANRTKSGILANMSHELRTPLNAIIGFSDIIRREAFGAIGEHRYIGYANDIHDSGTHLLALINDILDVSKAEAGRIELHEAVVDIGELFEACLRLVRARAEEASVELIAQPAGHLPHIQGDMLRLKQVLINLLSNAIKFTPSGGRVTLSAGYAGERYLYLKVEDTGVGMAPQDIPKALSPFGQLDSSLNRKHQGTGLGLPLSKALAELHGGRLEIVSNVGLGTAVTVYLPAARALAASQS
jgi:PAS domain S-box-containing protein